MEELTTARQAGSQENMGGATGSCSDLGSVREGTSEFRRAVLLEFRVCVKVSSLTSRSIQVLK